MNICVCGIGRAGKAMLHRIIESEHTIACALARPANRYINMDVGDYLGVPQLNKFIYSIDEDVSVLKKLKIDLIIDFSHREATSRLLEIANAIDAKLVICTTNHTELEVQQFKEYVCRNEMSVVYAPNLTLGINLLIDFVAQLSKILTDFDFEIVERHRKDKARGTTTADIISKAINRGNTHISSVRAGGYVGIHEVVCANENECIRVTHESFTRQAFADGALTAARFLQNKKGFFKMEDVIREIKEKALS